MSRRKPLGKILGEIAIVFVGITASFWVDDWREQRQDTETFHRILGEIYYDLRLDDSMLTGFATTNNLALTVASDLVLRDKPRPEGEELARQLALVFSSWDVEPAIGGHTRLTNTPLSIPVNDVQMALDNKFSLYFEAFDVQHAQIDRVGVLADQHWWSRGIVPCGDVMRGADVTGELVAVLDLANEVRPANDAVQKGTECIPIAANVAAATAAMSDPSFLTAVRQVIKLRREVAGNLAWLRAINAGLRGSLESYLPDISLPIKTLGLVGSATPADWDVRNYVVMQRTAANEWVADVTLNDGEVKFAANREWTINWGAPRPWLGTAAEMTYAPGQIALDRVFPSGRSQFNGINIPVRAGRYHVTFNSRTGEYRFESKP